MDLNHVSAFVRVVREGSFTAAARALGVPKSSVSRSVAQLEETLGVRLLFRTTRKIHLTEAGASFYERASRAVAELDEASSAASELQEKMRGVIRVTAPLDLGVWALASLVSRFVKRHSAVRVEVSLTSRAVDLAAEGFDLAVRAGPVRDESLVARRIGILGSYFFASSRYVARRGRPATLEELGSHDCVTFRWPEGRRAVPLVSDDGVEAEVEVRGSIVADDMSFLKKVVLAGAGIGLLPDFLCAREEQSGKLVRVLPSWSFRGAPLSVVYPSARYVPQRVALFRDFLVRELADVAKACDAQRRPGRG